MPTAIISLEPEAEAHVHSIKIKHLSIYLISISVKTINNIRYTKLGVNHCETKYRNNYLDYVSVNIYPSYYKLYLL